MALGCLFGCLLIVLGASTAYARQGARPAAGSAAAQKSRDLALWYGEPAAEWNEALPIGNGSIGAMVFGGPSEARFQFAFEVDLAWKGGKLVQVHVRSLLGRDLVVRYDGNEVRRETEVGEQYDLLAALAE